MASFTSSQAGNWSNTATWSGSGPPGNGDTVTISHAVAVDANTTVGNSPSNDTSMVLTIGTGGTLTIKTGATLVLRGNAVQNAATADVTMEAGSTLEFDASQADTPSTNYKWDVKGGFSGSDAPRFICNGTEQSRVTIRSNAGGGNGIFAGTSGGGYDEGYHQWEYVDALRIGTSSVNAIFSRPTYHTQPVYFKHCRFDYCGRLLINAAGGARDFEVSDCMFRNCLTSALQITGPNNSAPSGTRKLERCTFDTSVSLTSIGQTVEDNVFCAGISFLTYYTFASFTGNLVRYPNIGGSQMNIPADVVGNWFYMGDHASAQANLHWLKINESVMGSSHDLLIEDNVFESDGSDGEGDIVYQYVTTRDLHVRGNLTIPDLTTGDTPGTLMTTGANSSGATGQIYCEQNTHYGGHQSMLVLNENSQGKTGVVASCRGNLTWTDPDFNGGLGCWIINDVISGNSGPEDMVDPGDAQYNASYGLASGSTSNKYYRLKLSDYTAVGAGDLRDTDPQFFDPTRNVATWGASLGLSGSDDRDIALQVWDAMVSRLADDGNANFTVANYLAYVREGFAPTNEAYRDAGYNGVTFGAVEMAEGVSVNIAAIAHHRRLMMGAF